MKMTQNFRAYADYSSGFIDYASLLKSRYSAALAAAGDGEVFANLDENLKNNNSSSKKIDTQPNFFDLIEK